MRVIAGVARGRPLAGPTWASTRPTSDRVKEALFGMLESLLGVSAASDSGAWDGIRILDLYAGSGALGIEALSRGAAFADFVDGDRRCVQLIQRNLERSGLADRGRAYHATASAYVTRAVARSGDRYGLIVLDPPYGEPVAYDLLAAIQKVASDSALVVLERSSRAEALDWPRLQAEASLHAVRERRHGDTTLVIADIRDNGRA